MNKNKKVVKAMSSVLCASMLMGNVTPVFATTNETQTTSSNEKKEVEVLYNKSASYFVTIPKTITLDSNKESTYNVKVEGDIPSDKNVYVAPEDAISQTNEIDFYMHDQSTKHPKADVAAIVTQNKDTWDFEDVANGVEETTNKISASQLTAGNWKGTFNFNINLKDIENYGEDVTLTRNNLATYGIANTGDVTIPSVVTDSDGTKHKVTSIGVSAFNGCSRLDSIEIPNSVTSIGDEAFSYTPWLAAKKAENPLVIVNNILIDGSTASGDITIPDSVTSIGGHAFYGCFRLTSIIIPNSVTSIGTHAFNGCFRLTSIIIPNSVTSIETQAFTNCTSLKNVTLSNNIKTLGDNIFHISGVKAITYKDITYTSESKLKEVLINNNIEVPNNFIGNSNMSK